MIFIPVAFFLDLGALVKLAT